MKTRFTFYLLLAVLAAPSTWADPPPNVGWTVTFDDEFNDSNLDHSKWHTTYSGGLRTNAGNKEAEYYADDAFEFKNGVMRIRADKRDKEGFHYTSGLISNYGNFSQQYGYFEMKARLPKGQGYWPAFWLMPTNPGWPPEIDIMENLGQVTTVVRFTNHYDKDNKQVSGTYGSVLPDFSDDFHIFGLLWEKDKLVWYIDNVERFRTDKGIPQEPMYIIANLAVGGSWGGYPDKTTSFPGYMDIDYIRVYQDPGKSTEKH